MRICFPIESDRGLDSPVCGHFGSTPAFLVVDSETSACQVLNNDNEHHAHGACQPLRSLGALSPDAVVVGGIGAGALMKLNAAGVRVFRACAPTVAENLQAFRTGTLEEVDPGSTCGGHGHGHGCGH